MDILIVEGLEKEFSGKRVLDGVSFRIREGEGVGIVGKSGSGKSVLINALKGIREYRPTKGSVIYRLTLCGCGWLDPPSMSDLPCPRCGSTSRWIEELDLWEMEGTEAFKEVFNRTAIMLQRTFSLYSEATVWDNLMEALRLVNYPKNKRQERIRQTLRRVNMIHRSTYIARDLSAGEKQRIVLARQLVREPVILFADEPTGTIDPKTMEMINASLRAEIDEGLTMILTSKWFDTLRITDRCILLEDGGIAAIGKVSEILDQDVMDEFGWVEKKPVPIGGPKIIVENCSKIFYRIEGVAKPLQGVSFTINEREIFGLIGVSGSGKTTIGRIIGGVTQPSSGRVLVRMGDEWIDMREPGERGRGKVTAYLSMLHEEYSLHHQSTVFENLTTSIGLTMPEDIGKERVLRVLKAVGMDEKRIDEILPLYPDSLSEVEKRMVAMAQALMPEPFILILDDPVVKPDLVRSILRSREELGQTYLVISHDHEFIKAICDRVMLIREGKVISIGDPDEIVRLFNELETPMGAGATDTEGFYGFGE